MSFEKAAKGAILTPLIIIVMYAVLFYELVTAIPITTDVCAYGCSNISIRSVDNIARIIITTYVPSNVLKSKEDNTNNNQNPDFISSSTNADAGIVERYQWKDRDEYNNIGLVDMGISIPNNNSSGHRHRLRRGNNSFENNSNNNDFYLDDIKASNNITDKRNNSTVGSGSSNKLLHSSFRIEQETIKSLERVAASRDISLSSLVNKILKNYVTSEIYFEELGFLLVSKNFLRKTFEGLDQKNIEELGKEYGRTIAKEYVSYFYPQVNVDTLIQFLDIWFRRFQSRQYRIDANDNRLHYFTVNHDINMNFSLMLRSILDGLIEPIIMSTVEFTNVSPSAITFSFRV